MNTTGQKRFRVRLLQPQASANDLGEMSETQVYAYLRIRAGENRADEVMSELEHSRSAAAEFEAPIGPKTRVEITEI